jgi:hypothetical protein
MKLQVRNHPRKPDLTEQAGQGALASQAVLIGMHPSCGLPSTGDFIRLLGRYVPPVRMIKLKEQRQITPSKWVHPDEER